MIKIIRKDEVVWVNANLRIKAAEKLSQEQSNSKYFKEIIASGLTGEIYNNDIPWMKDRAPVNRYALQYHKELRPTEKNVVGFKDFDSKETQQALQEAKTIFANCLEHGFVRRSDKNPELICLTKKGRDFSDPTFVGFIKEELKAIGVVWGIFAWVGSLVVANPKAVKDFFVGIWEKLF